MINPERTCYAFNPNGKPCRAIAVRGQLQCFAHGPRGRRLQAKAVEQARRRFARRRPLTPSELGALATRFGVASYFPDLMVAIRMASES